MKVEESKKRNLIQEDDMGKQECHAAKFPDSAIFTKESPDP